jgi:hypothetical protein
MELSFTEYDNLDKQNTSNDDSLYYKTYYDNLLQQTNGQQVVNKIDIEKPEPKPSFRNNIPLTKNTNNAEKQKKRISYDDILSSMNTVVINGKLEFISKDKLNNILEKNNPDQNAPIKKRVTFNEPRQQQQQQQPMQPVNKNSYIYNKFFKDYKDPNQNQYQDFEEQRPLTKKELINQIITNRINDINQRNRIAQIKSTRLLFNNNNRTDIVINSTQSREPLNRLFRF